MSMDAAGVDHKEMDLVAQLVVKNFGEVRGTNDFIKSNQRCFVRFGRLMDADSVAQMKHELEIAVVDATNGAICPMVTIQTNKVLEKTSFILNWRW